MIIDKTGGLEMGVAYCRAEEFEATAFHIFGYCI